MTKVPVLLTAAAFAAFALAARADGPGHARVGGPRSDAAAAAKQKETDRLLAAAQKICPVTGEPLDSMGGPVKATADGRTVFFCCKGCVGKEFDPAHWARAQGHMAAAQGICPVMKHELPENPASVVVEGRTVFVCCKPCVKKIQADPAKAFAVVDTQLKKHAAAEARARGN